MVVTVSQFRKSLVTGEYSCHAGQMYEKTLLRKSWAIIRTTLAKWWNLWHRSQISVLLTLKLFWSKERPCLCKQRVEFTECLEWEGDASELSWKFLREAPMHLPWVPDWESLVPRVQCTELHTEFHQVNGLTTWLKYHIIVKEDTLSIKVKEGLSRKQKFL